MTWTQWAGVALAIVAAYTLGFIRGYQKGKRETEQAIDGK